ncbi:MAG: sugar ABC transporter permease [Clostridiales bacterium]|nr:sugar ABC transporter permease [Clostridiales bacterium]
MSTIKSNALKQSARRHRALKDLGAWLIMLPGIALFAFFVWVPLAEAVRMSFYKTQGMRTTEFVGLYNYSYMMLKDPDFWPAVRNSFLYTGWSLVIGFLVPMALAMMIHETKRGKSLFRTAVYLPNMMPALATIFLWKYLFRADQTGYVNMLLGKLGIAPVSWLSNAQLVIPVIVVIMTWKGAGATTLIYLAGLQSISQEIYEAAIIDGAGIWSRIRHITLPQIYNLARTLFILQIIAVFQILYEPMVLTGGGPNNASVSLMQLVFRQAFELGDYAKASSVSVMVSVVLITMTLVYNQLSRKKEM